jgi:type VI secretion system Hcp family effector
MKKLLLLMILWSAANISLHAQTVTVTISFAANSGIATGTSIQLSSFKIGATQPPLTTYVGAAASAAKSQFTPLTLYKNIDATSPMLFLDCALGKPIKNATLTVFQDSTPIFQILLEGVFISSINDDSTMSNGGPPLESFSLSYGIIAWAYIPPSGPAETAAFNLETNTNLSFSQVLNSVDPGSSNIIAR